jgi:hypothetical protein
MKDNNTRNLLITCAVLLLVACVCLSLVVIVGTGLFFLPARVTGQSVITVEATLVSPAQVTPEATISSPPADSELSPDVIQQMDQIQKQDIELRGLQPTGDVKRALLTPDQLRQHVVDNFLKDYSQQDAQDDAITLAAFGLLDPGFDLYHFYISLYSEQIAGFYDDETKEMYVVQGEGFQGPERLTYSHEYDHALQDQNYDLKNGLNYNDTACKADSERCAAVQALIEGDATVLETEWLSTYATPLDLAEITKFYSTYNSPVYDSAPDFMKEDFVFPYNYGQTFVQSLHDKGGWKAVDQVYHNPPVSTEQILHPERYPTDQPIPVDIPDLSSTLGSGWRKVDSDVLGEWYTYLCLAHGIDARTRLDDSQAKDAAEGWGGDAYAIYYNDQSQATVLVLKSTWDAQTDADQFDTAFRKYATLRFGSPQVNQSDLASWSSTGIYAEFHRSGSDTTWILGPDSTTVQAVWSTLP